MSDIQEAFLARVDMAIAFGVVACAVIVALLAIIAVRGLWS